MIYRLFISRFIKTVYKRHYIPNYLIPINLSKIPNNRMKHPYLLFRSNYSTSKSNYETWKAVKNLFSQTKVIKWKLLGGICLLFISSGVTLSIPLYLGKVIDTVFLTSEDRKKNLKNLCYLLILVFCLGAAANFGRIYLIQISGHTVVQNLRKNLFKSIINQDISFFDRQHTGELISRLNTDTSLIAQSVTQNISDGLRAVVMALSGVSLMFYMSTKLTLISLSIVPPLAITGILFGRFLRQISRKAQDGLASSSKLVEERISGIRTVQAFGKEMQEYMRYSKELDLLFQLNKRESIARAIFYALSGFSGNLVAIAVLYNGSILISDSVLSLGQLTSFLVYTAYVGVSLSMLSTFYSDIMKGIGATYQIWKLMEEKPVISLNKGIYPDKLLEGNISFQNVHFAYPQRLHTPVLTGLNVHIPAYTTTAIIGPSGCGKSSLVSLLLRFYDVDSGCITIDNYPIQNISPLWLRNSIGLVSQEPMLFSGSLRDNILYGTAKQYVSEEELNKIVEQANILEFVEKFPNGLDTVIGTRGVLLSGGQKQRVAIARALIKKPQIFIFDEATSSLDVQNECLIQVAIEKIKANHTVIIIAHRLSTIKDADNIVVMHNGRIIEEGTFANLLNQDKSFFREMVQRQSWIQHESNSLSNWDLFK